MSFKKYGSLFFILISIFLIFIVDEVNGANNVTNLNTLTDYTSIQSAVNSASNNDVLFIHNGIYVENAIINKPLTLFGESILGVIVDGNRTGNPISITANNVSISNLTVLNSSNTSDSAGIRANSPYNNTYLSRINATSNPSSGIHITTSHSIIDNCFVSDNIWGIRIDFGTNYTIQHNEILSNQRYDLANSAYGQGIRIITVTNSSILNNTIVENAREGVLVSLNSIYVAISDNIINENGFILSSSGIAVFNSNYTNILNNSFSKNNGSAIQKTVAHFGNISNNEVFNHSTHSIMLSQSNSVYVSSNSVNVSSGDNLRLDRISESFIYGNRLYSAASTFYGIRVTGSGGSGSTNNSVFDNDLINNANGLIIEVSSLNNKAYGNYITGSSYGIRLTSGSNEVYSNNISSNQYGIRTGSSSNLIYDNYFSNTNNCYFCTGTNTWNITKTVRTNILGGSYTGGNYWSNYAGFDRGDGFGSAAYDTSGGIDYLPLVSKYVEVFSVPEFNWFSLLLSLILGLGCILFVSSR